MFWIFCDVGWGGIIDWNWGRKILYRRGKYELCDWFKNKISVIYW